MRNFLKLYFEFAFKIDEDIEPLIVAKTNDMFMEVEDDNIDDDRLLTIYQLAIIKLDNVDGLRNFCLLPTIFMKQDDSFEV